MASKLLVLITGANQGLGFYAAQHLSTSGKYHILMGSRDQSKIENALSQNFTSDPTIPAKRENVEPLQIDVSSDDSIRAAAEHVKQKFGRLDILMPNAGVAHIAKPKSLRDEWHQLFDTNLFGAVVTVDAFLPLLRKSSAPEGKRIAFTSSGLASIQIALESKEGGYSAKNFPAYRSTKTAMNMMMAHYASLLEEEGFVVSASDPGYCATNLNNHSGLKDPREGAKALIRAATDVKDKVHARMVDETQALPW